MSKISGPVGAALFVTAILVSGAATGISIDSARADTCLAAPKTAAPGGQHWYFHIDRATRRKCWYLHAAGQLRHRAALRHHAVAAADAEAEPAPETRIAAAPAAAFAAPAPSAAIPAPMPGNGAGDTPTAPHVTVLAVKTATPFVDTTALPRQNTSEKPPAPPLPQTLPRDAATPVMGATGPSTTGPADNADRPEPQGKADAAYDAPAASRRRRKDENGARIYSAGARARPRGGTDGDRQQDCRYLSPAENFRRPGYGVAGLSIQTAARNGNRTWRTGRSIRRSSRSLWTGRSACAAMARSIRAGAEPNIDGAAHHGFHPAGLAASGPDRYRTGAARAAANPSTRGRIVAAAQSDQGNWPSRATAGSKSAYAAANITAIRTPRVASQEMASNSPLVSSSTFLGASDGCLKPCGLSLSVLIVSRIGIMRLPSNTASCKTEANQGPRDCPGREPIGASEQESAAGRNQRRYALCVHYCSKRPSVETTIRG